MYKRKVPRRIHQTNSAHWQCPVFVFAGNLHQPTVAPMKTDTGAQVPTIITYLRAFVYNGCICAAHTCICIHPHTVCSHIHIQDMPEVGIANVQLRLSVHPSKLKYIRGSIPYC